MLIPVVIFLPEWSVDMHNLDNAIRNCPNDEEVMYFAETLEYAHRIHDDIIFTFRKDGGDFGTDLYYAMFHRIR